MCVCVCVVFASMNAVNSSQHEIFSASHRLSLSPHTNTLDTLASLASGRSANLAIELIDEQSIDVLGEVTIEAVIDAEVALIVADALQAEQSRLDEAAQKLQAAREAQRVASTT